MGLRILVTVTLFIMSWTALTAQGRIRGNVLNAGDRHPLEGVSVAAVHLPDSTVVAVTLSDISPCAGGITDWCAISSRFQCEREEKKKVAFPATLFLQLKQQ